MSSLRLIKPQEKVTLSLAINNTLAAWVIRGIRSLRNAIWLISVYLMINIMIMQGLSCEAVMYKSAYSVHFIHIATRHTVELIYLKAEFKTNIYTILSRMYFGSFN